MVLTYPHDPVCFSSARASSSATTDFHRSTTSSPSPNPPSFSSLYSPDAQAKPGGTAAEGSSHEALPRSDPFGPAPPFKLEGEEEEEQSPRSTSTPTTNQAVAETKAALPPDTKAEPSNHKAVDDGEPPPPYSESSSPLDSFVYLMAVAGGPASLITQVQQGGPPINTLGGVYISNLARECGKKKEEKKMLISW